MRRRDFLVTLGGAAVTLGGAAVMLPAAALSQSPARPLVAILEAASEAAAHDRDAAFIKRLAALGYGADRNIDLVVRYDGAAPEAARRLGAALIALKPAVIVTSSVACVLALHALTASVPIVMAGIDPDPVALGLAQSLAHPGGNLTGVTMASSQAIFGKELELLKEMAPSATRIAALLHPGDTVDQRILPAAERNLKIVISQYVLGPGAETLAPVIARAGRETDALGFSPQPLLNTMRKEVVALVAKTRRPAIYPHRDVVAAGGLMSYGASLVRNFVIAAEYVAKILGGAKPGDLPIEQPDRYDLVINLKTAKAQGIVVPPALMMQANDVIE